MTSAVGGNKTVIVIVSLLASGRTKEWRYDRVITSYYMYPIELLQTQAGM